MSVGRLKLNVPTRMFWSRGEAQAVINHMKVKLHIYETQDDRECHHVNCNILGDIFNIDE